MCFTDNAIFRMEVHFLNRIIVTWHFFISAQFRTGKVDPIGVELTKLIMRKQSEGR